MAVIRPFRAVRPVKEVAHLVASVPYDVVNKEESAELAKGNPISFLRVTRSEIEIMEKINPYTAEVYKKAKDNYKRLKDEAPLIQEEKPCFYVYKLIMGQQEQIGIAATFAVDDYDKDVIKKHEKTRKEKEDDRTNHIITTEAQTGAVFLTYKDVEKIDVIVNKTIAETDPLYDFTAPDGIKHILWVMPEKYEDIVVKEIGKVKFLYIADGHHRAASASRARKVKQENNPLHTGNEEYNYFFAVLFPAKQLKIMPYNRVVHDLKQTGEEFLQNISKNFTVEKTGEPNPPKRKTISMYFEKEWYLLTPNKNVKEADNVGDNLDVSILQNYLLEPVFGIKDPRTDHNVDFIGGIRGTAELEKLVNNGKAAVAFSMYPLSVDDLINISDAGEIMPPKSTWFEPKLRDGLLVHEI